MQVFLRTDDNTPTHCTTIFHTGIQDAHVFTKKNQRLCILFTYCVVSICRYGCTHTHTFYFGTYKYITHIFNKNNIIINKIFFLK